MPQPPPTDPLPVIELVVRPLLRLAQHITGMESAFVTAIDWNDQSQEVLFSENAGALHIDEGGRVAWGDSLCRSMFLAGDVHTCTLKSTEPASEAVRRLDLESFFAVPLLEGERVVGTICGASRRPVELDASQQRSLELLAAALKAHLSLHAALRASSTPLAAKEVELQGIRSEMAVKADEAHRMALLAYTDPLTMLPNRRAFTARWEEELARSGRKRFPISVLLIDIDRFKQINDSHGHAEGDRVLQALGRALAGFCTSADIAARLGGDEFAFAATHGNLQDMLARAVGLQEAFAREQAGLREKATLSIGIAGSDAVKRRELFAKADEALYRAKHAGGNQSALAANSRSVATGLCQL